MDEAFEDAKSRVEEKKLDKIEHYQYEGLFFPFHKFSKYRRLLAPIQIFGKDGKMLYQGDPHYKQSLGDCLTKLAKGEEA